jgi:protein gp37
MNGVDFAIGSALAVAMAAGFTRIGSRRSPVMLRSTIWARGIRDTCTDADVAFFFKQWGGRTPKALGRELDGQLWDEMPATA